MLKIRVFANDPAGKTWSHFKEMAPGLGEKYQLEVEIIAKPRETYQSEEYQRSGLPAAPAIMVGDEVIARGGDLGEEQLEEAIRRHLASQQPRK